MNEPSVASNERFVTPYPLATPQATYEADYQIGRDLYKRDKPVRMCANAAQRDGWRDALNGDKNLFWRGEELRWQEKMQQAGAKFVNWNSGAEVW